MSVTDWDVIVLGCGSAGGRAGQAAQQAGAKTLVVDDSERLGGLCILRGCMPTKTLLETAHRMHDIHDAARFGIEVGAPHVQFDVMMKRMRALVDRFQRAKLSSIEGSDYELLRGSPRFVDEQTVEVDGAQHRAKAIVVATGSKTRDMPHTDSGRVLTSDDMFTLEEKPDAAVVAGGGAVGIEFATWLARIGTRVTLVNRSPLLRRSDPEMGQELSKALAEEMELLVPSTIASMRRDGDATVVTLDVEGEAIERRVDFLLNATGRPPNFDGLDIEQTGVEIEGGYATVGPTLRTNVPHLFLAGDVSGLHGILHEANREGMLAGRNAARVAGFEIPGELDEATGLEWIDDRVPPVEVIFCDPPYASAGWTPKECEAHDIPFRQATKRFPEQGRGIVVGARHGTLRLLAQRDSGAILGCQIFGPRADDMIHIVTTAITMGATVEDLLRVPWYHPTLTEAFIEVLRDLA